MKTFYSADDIEALVAQGKTELVIDESVVLTHLARDRAQKLGLKLIFSSSQARPSLATGPLSAPHGFAMRPGAKPKGCQHGPITGQAGASSMASDTHSPVEELIDLVKDLAKTTKVNKG